MIKKYKTQKQLGHLEEKYQILISHINKWCKVQLAYIPEIGLCVATTISQILAAEEVPFFTFISCAESSKYSWIFQDIGLCGLVTCRTRR